MACCLLSLLSTIAAVILAAGAIFKIYMKLSTGWCKSQTCLAGKTAIVTGANTGIGYETALDFAKRGAKVILACRNEEKAEEARSKIIKETGNENILVKLVDMGLFDSVRAFAKDINDTQDRLDILVNNAGVSILDDKRSQDGHVLVTQTNYYSSFLLTNLLIGLMKKTKRGRIVNVSSIAAIFGKRFDLNKIDEFPGKHSVYPHSKLCNILFTIELARRLEGTGITTYSLHPGSIQTELFRHFNGIFGMVVDFMSTFFKTCEEGAQTTIYCAVANGIEDYNGEHFAECQRVAPYKTIPVPDISKKLWELTETITQLKPEEVQF